MYRCYAYILHCTYKVILQKMIWKNVMFCLELYSYWSVRHFQTAPWEKAPEVQQLCIRWFHSQHPVTPDEPSRNPPRKSWQMNLING